MSKTRRELLRDMLIALPAGWVLVQTGCAGDSNSDCAVADKLVATATAITVTSVCNEHTHDFTIMKSDLTTPPTTGVMDNTSAYNDDGHVHTMALAGAGRAGGGAGGAGGGAAGAAGG